MVKVYAVILVLGLVAMVVVVIGGALAENMGRPERDPGHRIGHTGRTAVGAALGMGMAGMSAEFSTWDLSWPMSLLLAIAGGVAGGAWAWYSSRDLPSGADSDASSL
jgi:hypothetical protein